MALPLMQGVYNFALRLTRRSEDARDLVQETYLRAYRTFGNFRPGTNGKAWLFTILYSVFVNRYRKEQREPAMVSVEELVGELPDPSQGGDRDNVSFPIAAGTLAWAEPEVGAALRQLPESFRLAVLLVEVDELSYEEAASVLNCPVGTVRSRLFRARKSLSVALRDYARRAGYGGNEAT
jgi:RNA polymerase sigma-70 factor (ECF subfamily)